MKRKTLWGLLAAVLVVTTACQTAGPTAQPPVPTAAPGTTVVEPTTAPPLPEPAATKDGGDIIQGMDASFDTLDPHNWTGFFYATMTMVNIYDPLLARNPETKEIGPGLAERWDVSEDGKVITLYLQKGVKFHDGTAMDASDVDYAFTRIFAEETQPNVRTALASAVDTWKVVDSHTFEITLKTPSAAFLDSLTYPQLSVVCKGEVEKWGPDFGQHPCGTGPFMFKEWIPDDHVTLVKNPDYNWPPAHYGRTGPAYVDSVSIKIIPEATTRQAALEAGDLTVIMYPQNREVPRMIADPNFTAYPRPRTGMPRVLSLPTDRWPFDDVKVRQAVAYSLNRQEILDNVWDGVGAVTSAFLAPGTPCYWDGAEAGGIGYTYDLEKAKSLLAEAGWELGADGVLVKDGKPFKVTMSGFPTPVFMTLHQVVQAQLKAVGIEVEIIPLEQAAWMPAIRQAQYNFSDNQIGPGSDPSVLFNSQHSSQVYPNGWNTVFYSNPEVDRLLEAASSTMDQAERCELYAEVQKILLQDLPYVPFYAQVDYFLSTSKLQGLRFDPKSLPLYYDAHFEK
jgi:peptide/nickel transport system substrate-binding protein